MKILIASICLIVVLILWLRERAKRYYAKKLKDINEGNVKNEF